ncbi:uncharacterized protein FA14DRAFT_8566 [Meira miltonrushii]|uniref:Letm1 RBD domain-containing protein n=1 Tax=Meira miltonrushii TaxID=1280837 RepID=A0A316VH77_9BASI|nr:uncharacterized protein FA14DRAFT_8566 [Meira miltonrushii]PWN36999.1 hypothetical protein FA14DRAFT_8566 [Meira miltonrushii]
MRGNLANSIRRISSTSLAQQTFGATSSRNTATISRQSRIRHLSSSSAALISRPTLPRFQSDQYNRIESNSNASSSKDSFPPSLIKSTARRRNNKSTNGNSQVQSQGKEAADKYSAATQTNGPPIEQGVASTTEESSTSNSVKANAQSTQSTAADSTAKPSKTISERIKGLWENIKYLFRFYYNGVKQIWKDRALVQAKKKEIADRVTAGKGGALWSEKAMIELHQADVRKLPLFLAILIILEEVLPLVVIYAPSLLPSTCILPSQSLKMRAEEERRRGLAIQRMAKEEQVRNFVDRLASTSCEEGQASVVEAESSVVSSLHSLEKDVVRDIANVFGLRSWGPSSLVISRIEKHLRFLQEDDELLQKAYAAKDEKLADETQKSEWTSITNSPWLWRACGRRGIRSSQADESTMQRNLEAYLHLISSIKKDIASSSTSQPSLMLEYALVPLALYDGTPRSLRRLQGVATVEQSKGLRKRTQEVVDSVVQEEKRKEGVE